MNWDLIHKLKNRHDLCGFFFGGGEGNNLQSTSENNTVIRSDRKRFKFFWEKKNP